MSGIKVGRRGFFWYPHHKKYYEACVTAVAKKRKGARECQAEQKEDCTLDGIDKENVLTQPKTKKAKKKRASTEEVMKTDTKMEVKKTKKQDPEIVKADKAAKKAIKKTDEILSSIIINKSGDKSFELNENILDNWVQNFDELMGSKGNELKSTDTAKDTPVDFEMVTQMDKVHEVSKIGKTEATLTSKPWQSSIHEESSNNMVEAMGTSFLEKEGLKSFTTLMKKPSQKIKQEYADKNRIQQNLMDLPTKKDNLKTLTTLDKSTKSPVFDQQKRFQPSSKMSLGAGNKEGGSCTNCRKMQRQLQLANEKLKEYESTFSNLGRLVPDLVTVTQQISHSFPNGKKTTIIPESMTLDQHEEVLPGTDQMNSTPVMTDRSMNFESSPITTDRKQKKTLDVSTGYLSNSDMQQEMILPMTNHVKLTVAEIKVLKRKSDKYQKWTTVFNTIVKKYFDEKTLRKSSAQGKENKKTRKSKPALNEKIVADLLELGKNKYGLEESKVTEQLNAKCGGARRRYRLKREKMRANGEVPPPSSDESDHEDDE
uniref:BEN domain-containing protein n=1 Tax=Clytia hemisphaerica TaxID=252671 RepID=A0A7M5V366_9CNID